VRGLRGHGPLRGADRRARAARRRRAVRVAVVGAGLSGLAAARRLTEAGHQVTVFEKSRGLGGRLAARRLEGTVVEHGAPALDAPAGTPLAELAGSLGAPAPAAVTAPLRGVPPPDAPMQAPHAFAQGLTQLAKRMAEGLEVVRGVRVATLRPAGGGYEIGDEQGNGHGRADAVVVSAPPAQAADLLDRSPEPPARAAALRALAHHPAVVAILGVPMPAPPPWFLLWPPEGPLAAVAVPVHAGREAVDGVVPVVARLAPGPSAAMLDAATDEEVVAAMRPALAGVLGAAPEVAWSQVKRWRFSTVARRGDANTLNPPGSRIVLCGDALSPPGMAAVYEGGLAAAARVAALAPVTA